jgi:hypothetical protein
LVLCTSILRVQQPGGGGGGGALKGTDTLLANSLADLRDATISHFSEDYRPEQIQIAAFSPVLLAVVDERKW